MTPPLAVVIAGAGLTAAGVVAAGHALRRHRAAGVLRAANAIPVHSAFWRAQRRESGDLLYVALGDSAAQGIGASRPDRGYVGLLARSVHAQTGHTVRVVNLSLAGGRLRDVLEKQLPALAKLDADIVTIAIGANDMADFDAARFEQQVTQLCDALPEHAIVAEVPSFYLGRFERSVRAANDILRRVATRHGLPVARLHRSTVQRTAARTVLRDVAGDFFHPNDRGHAVWASAFAPLVAQAAASFEPPVLPNGPGEGAPAVIGPDVGTPA